MKRGLNDREFVAAQTRDGVGVARTLSQPLGNAFEQPVPDRMSVGVVDGLEPIDVEIQHGDAAASRDARESAPQILEEQHTIGKVGQRIVVSQTRYPSLGPATLGY